MKKSDWEPPCWIEEYKKTLAEKAEIWMDENPDMMQMFREYAKQMLSRKRCFGIGLLSERVRWEAKVNWTGDYKISNNHRAYIARRLIKEMPALEELMVTKKVKDAP